MTAIPDEPHDADPAQLEQAASAIDDAKAAAGRVAKDDTINTDDLPTGQESVPAAPPPSGGEDLQSNRAEDDESEPTGLKQDRPDGEADRPVEPE